MENLVPLGTGNSRLMKSNIPASTTLAQLIQMLNNGTFPYDIGPLNPAGISQQGTPLNKATLFSDQTMAKYPSGIEDPNDAFEKLANATLYQAYKQSITDINGNTLLTLPATQIYTGSYTGTGVEGQSNPTSIVLPKKPDIVIIGTCDQYNHLYFSLFPVGYFPNNIDVEGGYTLFDRGATLGGGNTTIIRSCYAKFNDSTKELTWSYRYSSIGSNGSNQLNGRNTTYVWHAICFP